jgi:hypothetical protein
MIASTSLSLSASAYVNKCGGKTSTTGLTFAWKVIENDSKKVQSSIVSVLKDDTKFKTKPNVFVAGKSYEVIVRVTDSNTELSSDASVNVAVLPSPLVAKLNPSTAVVLLRVGTSISLDGKSSYDPDSPSDNSKLLYLWNCISSIGGSCPLSLVAADTDTTAWFAAESAVNTTANIALTVVDTIVTGRNSSTSMAVKVIEGDAPIVTIKTDMSAIQKVNIQEKISLAGSVYSMSSSCVATWNVEQSWKLSLSSMQTNSPLSISIQPGIVTALSLTLPARSMQGRESYTFSLSCGKSSTFIVVKTNGAPYAGILSVDPPTTGVELTTVFLLSAS